MLSLMVTEFFDIAELWAMQTVFRMNDNDKTGFILNVTDKSIR